MEAFSASRNSCSRDDPDFEIPWSTVDDGSEARQMEGRDEGFHASRRRHGERAKICQGPQLRPSHSPSWPPSGAVRMLVKRSPPSPDALNSGLRGPGFLSGFGGFGGAQVWRVSGSCTPPIATLLRGIGQPVPVHSVPPGRAGSCNPGKDAKAAISKSTMLQISGSG